MMCRTSAVILFRLFDILLRSGSNLRDVLDKNTNSPIEYATIILKQGDKILEGHIKP